MTLPIRPGNSGTLRSEDPSHWVKDLVRAALDEDVGAGDFTTLWTVDENVFRDAVIIAKQSLVVSGVGPACAVFSTVDGSLSVSTIRGDGASAEPGDEVLRIEGRARSILTAERTALNFLGRLSGIATLTRQFAEAVWGTHARVIDTRKTTPGFRRLEKAAVLHGGGANHRVGLFDMVLIKDNHIAASGGIEPAVRRVQAANRVGLPVEVEVTNLEELEVALGLGVERVLLDNMTPRRLREAVARVGAWEGERPLLEASGNISMETVREVAETGVDFISVGALTHSAPTADFSLKMTCG